MDNDNDIDVDIDFEVLPQLTPEEEKQLELEHEEKVRNFYKATHQYSLEHWYEQLNDFTFRSASFELTNIEAYLLTLIYHEDQEILQQPEIVAAKERLIEKVDKFLEKEFPNGCFMKLSTRSPKDAGWRYKTQQDVKHHILKLTDRLKGTKTLDNEARTKIYRYFLQESKDKVKVKSGQDFIEIFANSQRIQIDINDLAMLNNRAFKKLGEKDYSSSNEKLIDVWGREWVDCQWMEEFRCFYHNYQLTAVSQYDQRCYFPQLKGKEGFIVQKVTTFFERIRPKLEEMKLSKGVMDLIVKMQEEEQVILIQINIFDHNSRASLFNWSNDLDILENGPNEIRLLQQQIQISKHELVKMMGMVEKGIGQLLLQVMKQLGLESQWQQLQ